MEEEFGIQIEDGSHVMPQFAVEQNSSSIQLHDWQRKAIKFFFDSCHVALYEVTTGAGKTYCAIEILKEIWKFDPEAKFLIVVPKNVILERGWYTELYDAGIHIPEIGTYYGAFKEYSKITITNMQNLTNVALELFDGIIFDEIHNYGTPRLLPIVATEFKYKIGLSATMERMDNKHWKILEIFNYNMFKYSPQQALVDNVLNPFNFVNISVVMDNDSYEKYTKLTQELNVIMKAGGGFNRIMKTSSGLKFTMLTKMNERKNLVNNYKRKFDVIKQICDKHRNDKVIVFNEYNKQTNMSYWHLLDIGVNPCVIHSGIDKVTREERLTDYKNDKYNILLTSKVLDEGYNLPKLDVAIIAAGNSTSRQTIQRMGRVLRKKDKHSLLYQLFCKDTVEEDYAIERAKLFKALCSDYEEHIYTEEDNELDL